MFEDKPVRRDAHPEVGGPRGCLYAHSAATLDQDLDAVAAEHGETSVRHDHRDVRMQKQARANSLATTA
jgi:hypothetical protein